METMLKNQLAKDGILAENATFGFHWPPFISVKHLHMHGIGPKQNMGFLARWIFKPLNLWYCTVRIKLCFANRILNVYLSVK